MKELQPYYSQCDSKRFEVLAVSFDSDIDKWKHSYQENGFKWQQLNESLSWNSPIVGQYGIRYLPTSLLVNRNGLIVSKNPSIAELRIVIGV